MKSPKESLHLGRKLYNAARYAEALVEYEWFFENATSIEPSYHGVRLSYCLAEWHDLGKVYDPALKRLKEKQQESFQDFLSSGDRQKFNDFESISVELGDTKLVIEKFLLLDREHKEIAPNAWLYARGHFFKEEDWKICGKYLTDPEGECKNLLNKFLSTMELHIKEPGLFGDDKPIVRWLIEDSHYVLRTLKNSGRKAEEEEALRRIVSTLETEGYGKHKELICNYA